MQLIFLISRRIGGQRKAPEGEFEGPLRTGQVIISANRLPRDLFVPQSSKRAPREVCFLSNVLSSFLRSLPGLRMGKRRKGRERPSCMACHSLLKPHSTTTQYPGLKGLQLHLSNKEGEHREVRSLTQLVRENQVRHRYFSSIDEAPTPSELKNAL